MLYEFLTLNHDTIIEMTCAKAGRRPEMAARFDALRHGVPLFLTQLSETLRRETSAEPFPAAAIGEAAARHGGELLEFGLGVSQVVHVYGDICQAVTELAEIQEAPITVAEFRVLNRSLDTAIADAVTEHARLTASNARQAETERFGHLAHELRNHVQAALLSFAALKRGTVAMNGSTAAVLGRSLTSLRVLIDSTVAEVRLAAGNQPQQRTTVGAFLTLVVPSADLLAEHHGAHFATEAGDPALPIVVNPELLASAVTNLLQNAFKFSRPGGRVVLRTRRAGDRAVLEIEDECGGLPPGTHLFRGFAERRGTDRTGLGLGLSIAREAVQAHGGDIQVRNLPGRGCIFAIELPLAGTLQMQTEG